MTPRERILSILKGGQPDRVPWFADLDYFAFGQICRGKRPKDFRSSAEYIQWHRELGVGFYLQGFFPFKTILDGCEEKIWHEGNRRWREIETPKGTLRDCWEFIPATCSEGPVEHLVKSERDLAAYRWLYEHTHWEADYSYAYQRLEEIGEMGILLCYLPKSPFMQLVALDAGIVAVTFAEMNAPDEFAETLEVVKKSFDKAAQISLDSPAEALMIPENLSSEMVGPTYFEKYMRGYQEEWTQKIADAGKYSFVHMDGTLRGLLKQEASAGFSVIEAMTPEPVGDLSIHQWAEVADNPNTILWGGIPGSYFTGMVDDKEFDRHVIEVLSVMRQSPRYVLGVADQVPPDGLESRIRRVAELVDLYGTYV